MRIRIEGEPQNVDRKTVCKALRFYARTLMSDALVSTLTVNLKFCQTRGFKASVGWIDRPERAKRFKMLCRETMSREATLSALAHEMVHAKQYATGQMRDYLSDPDFVRWEKEAYEFTHEEDETYWFAPWEIEAYGKERGLMKLFLKTLK